MNSFTMRFGSTHNSENNSTSNSSGSMERVLMVEEDRAAANALTALMARVSAATISGRPQPVTTTSSLPAAAAKADQEDEEETKEILEIPQRFTKSGRKRAVSFPLKLLKVLSDRNLAHIITWTPSGKSFTILKPKLFVAEVLPDHFKSAKFSSFTRKLHRWGFLRHYRGEEAGCYYHKEFQRGRLDLVENMTCHKVSGSTSTPFESALSVEVEASKTGIDRERPSSRGDVPLAALSATAPMERMTTPLMPASMISFQRQMEMSRQQLSVPTGFTAATNNSDSMSALVATASEMPSQNTLMAAEINAAIELEVSRRLQERIQLAAAQMAVRSAVLPSDTSRNAAIPGAGATSSTGISTGMSSFNDSAASAALRVKLHQLQQQKEQMQQMELMAMTGGYGFAAMPSRGIPPAQAKNVQGAKTA